MGVIKRVKRVFVADLHDMVDKMENPVSLIKQYLREVEEQIEKGKEALRQQYVVEKKYELLITDAEQTISKRVRQAKLALSKGEEDIAKIALQEKVLTEKKLVTYKEQLELINGKTQELVEQLQTLQQKYEELTLKKNELISRTNVAVALKNINENTSSFNADQAISGFARMEEKVWELEAASKAQRTISVNQKIPALNPLVANEVDEELQKLKEDQ
ncbi:PspA/IM30 family protein [Fredinandcohnia onubensis]|uniref:PspA/IM30 family protein n=1 Tax=Fredinandcohnia onubensis TaxID=1571209 RepID=UPI000C0BC290|nr:PspA/IM30 family protein [Fredinandcohnia onubensis]